MRRKGRMTPLPLAAPFPCRALNPQLRPGVPPPHQLSPNKEIDKICSPMFSQVDRFPPNPHFSRNLIKKR